MALVISQCSLWRLLIETVNQITVWDRSVGKLKVVVQRKLRGKKKPG